MKKNLKLILPSFLFGIFLGIFVTQYFLTFSSKGKANAAYALGLDEYKKENYHKAISLFSMSIGLKPYWYGSHLALANSLKMIGQTKLSLEEYNKALGLLKETDALEKADKDYILNQIKLLKNSAVETGTTIKKGERKSEKKSGSHLKYVRGRETVIY